MEAITKTITESISRAAEILAALIIGTALLLMAFRYFISPFFTDHGLKTEDIRIRFGSAVAVALELLLAADVLATAVAPSWNDIGQLAAIAIIRTLLNYFLEKELKQAH